MPKSWERHYSVGSLAAGMIVPRYALSDMIRRSGLEAGARRLSFVDVVLVVILERQLRVAGVKASERFGALANALRPFATRVVEQYGQLGEELFIRLDAASPVAVAWFNEASLKEPWRVCGFDSLRECGEQLAAVDPLNREPLDLLMVDIASVFKRAQFVVDRAESEGDTPAEDTAP